LTVCQEERSKMHGARFSALRTDEETAAAIDAKIVVSINCRRFIVGSISLRSDSRRVKDVFQQIKNFLCGKGIEHRYRGVCQDSAVDALATTCGSRSSFR